MPERVERFFWLFAERADQIVVSAIEDLHGQFSAGWQECPLEWNPCVEEQGMPGDRLWLFRLLHGVGNRALPRKFNKQFQAYIQALRASLNLTERQIKRRSNLPTPLFFPPLDVGPTDVGLHAVNDESNGMLVTYTYYSGQYYQPPHLQLAELRKLVSTVRDAWGTIACNCHGGQCPECNGDGCFACFKFDCGHCGGTGWKNYSGWAQSGFKIKYETGFPIAEI